MSTAVLQSEIMMTHFGGVGLPWPDPDRRRILLQTPSAFPRMSPQAGRQIPSNRQPALADIAKDWVATILQSAPAHRSQTSVIDMPPLDLGRVLRPMNGRDDLLEEMLDDTRF
jgi:hypothetical protein